MGGCRLGLLSAVPAQFRWSAVPETQTTEELQDVSTVIDTIEEAFADVSLDDGRTIHEAALEGVYWDNQTRLDARAKDPEKRWQEIPDWKLERFHAALSFFGPIGWRFHIPAYMRWTLRNWRTTSASQTIDSTVWTFDPNWSRDRSEILSDAQGRAVLAFLQFFQKYSGEPEASLYIAAYWYRYQQAADSQTPVDAMDSFPEWITISTLSGSGPLPLPVSARILENSGIAGVTATSTKEDVILAIGWPDDMDKSQVPPRWIKFYQQDASIHLMLEGSRITYVTIGRKIPPTLYGS